MEFVRGIVFLGETPEQKRDILQYIGKVVGQNIPAECTEIRFGCTAAAPSVSHEEATPAPVAASTEGPSIERRAAPLVIERKKDSQVAATTTTKDAPAIETKSAPAPAPVASKPAPTKTPAEQGLKVRPSSEPAVTYEEAVEKYGFNKSNGSRFTLTLSNEEIDRIVEWRGNAYSVGISFTINGMECKEFSYYEEKGDKRSFTLRLASINKFGKKEVITAVMKVLGFNIVEEAAQKDQAPTYDVTLSKQQLYSYEFLRFCCEDPSLKFNPFREEFKPELIGKIKEIPRIEEFTKFPLTVAPLCAAFLIECYGNDQKDEEKHLFTKRYFTEKTRYSLCLIEPMPVAFEKVGNAVVLTFADCTEITAEDVRKQVEFAMVALTKTIRVISATFQNIDANNNPIDVIKAFVARTGHAVVMSGLMNVWGTNMSIGSFQMMIVPKTPALQARHEVELTMSDLFDQLRVYQCSACSNFYSGGKNKACPDGECITGYVHEGERMPFEDDGEWEHKYPSDDGTGMDIYECWTCCGERLKDDIPCLAVSGNRHVTNDDGISRFDFGLA